MKPSSFLSTPFWGVLLFCFASCGNQNSSTSSGTTDSTTTTTDTTSKMSTTSTAAATPSPAASTTITTPQNMMVVRHKVANFNKWLTSYEAHDSMRLASGVHSYVIGRGLKDSNTVFVATRIDDVNKAKAFGMSPSLKQAMQRGGVVGTPMVSFTTMTFQDTGTIASDLRVRSTFMVKDWDRWVRAFDSGRQLRMDNGLAVRAYGHDANDTHKVTVVMALMDTTKAFALWKSDEMKKRQAASGMIGSPDRFVYRLVKRY